MSRALTYLMMAGIFSAFLAGCVGGDGAPKKTETSGATVDAGGGSEGETGVIRGMVLNDEKQPLADASVAILKSKVAGKTDALGGYAFLNLAPGDYEVAASKLGFDGVVTPAKVVAGTTTYVNFTLPTLAVSNVAYPQFSSHKAKLQCMLKTAVWVSSCSYPYTAVYLTAHEHGVNLSQYNAPPDIMDNKWRYNFSVSKGATWIVSEMVWKAQSDVAKELNLRLCTPVYDAVLDDCVRQYAAVAGPSPVVKTWEVTNAVLPKTAKGIWVMSAVWPTFPSATAATQNGVFLDQTIEMFNTVWYNGDPPEEWSLTKPPAS